MKNIKIPALSVYGYKLIVDAFPAGSRKFSWVSASSAGNAILPKTGFESTSFRVKVSGTSF
jgi:hypothetical protein